MKISAVKHKMILRYFCISFPFSQMIAINVSETSYNSYNFFEI